MSTQEALSWVAVAALVALWVIAHRAQKRRNSARAATLARFRRPRHEHLALRYVRPTSAAPAPATLVLQPRHSVPHMRPGARRAPAGIARSLTCTHCGKALRR